MSCFLLDRTRALATGGKRKTPYSDVNGIFGRASANQKDDPDRNVQESLQEIRELLDTVRAHHAAQPHEIEDPRNAHEDDVGSDIVLKVCIFNYRKLRVLRLAATKFVK